MSVARRRRPIVVVGGAAGMGSPIGKRSADAYDEDGAVLPRRLPLTGGCVQVGVLCKQVLAVDEGDLLGQARLYALIGLVDEELGALDCAVDLPDRLLELLQIPLIWSDHLLPVPLVDVDRMDLVDVVVGAQCVHVGVQAIALAVAVVCQGHPLPLRQGLDDLHLLASQLAHREADGTLDAVEVVVDAAA